MNQIIYPPTKITVAHLKKIAVYLGGEYSPQLISHLDDHDVVVFNSESIAGYIDDLEWSFEAQEDADVICYYFGPDHETNIGLLLDLGLFARYHKKKLVNIIVHYDDYESSIIMFNKIKFVCDEFGIPLSTEFNDFLSNIDSAIAFANKKYFD